MRRPQCGVWLRVTSCLEALPMPPRILGPISGRSLAAARQIGHELKKAFEETYPTTI